MAAYIHHVQLCTKDGAKFVQKFVQNANFKLFAERTTDSIRQWAIRGGSAVFVINEPVISNDLPQELSIENRHKLKLTSSCSKLTSDGTNRLGLDSSNKLSKSILHNRHIPPLCFSSNKNRDIETVFNVSFEVPNVEQSVERAQRNGAKILCEPTEVHDDSGRVVVASVQSCIGNVVHMLLNTAEYHGVFLPGFKGVKSHLNLQNSYENFSAKTKGLLTHLDHVTFAANKGDSSHILEWYEKCFGMKRFKLSRYDKVSVNSSHFFFP